MHYRSSPPSSFPCSRKTFVGFSLILCIYVTFQNSISLHKDSISSPKIKSVNLPSSIHQDEVFVDTNRELFHLSSSTNHDSPPPPPLPLPSPVDVIEPEVVGGLAQDFKISWGDDRAKFHDNGSLLTLSLDRFSGSGFQSKNEYLFAKIDMQIKLIPGNSAGTVTTYYLSSNGSTHDEIDFEFLGNVSGQPYTLHTNIYSQGKGDREMQFALWFDPTLDFHTYSILWNPKRIVFYVDGTPIREFENMEKIGVPFPKNQAMRIYSSLWNADDWATQGGRVHTNWSLAPFVSSYRNFTGKACVWSYGTSSCGLNPMELSSNFGANAWLMEDIDARSMERMRWVQERYITYDYCKDKWRFPEGLPKECTTGKRSNSGQH